MRFTIQVQIESAGVLPLTVPVKTIDRPCEQVEEVGLQVAEAKLILASLQQCVIRNQLSQFLADRRSCPHCRRPRPVNGYHPLRFRSAYGMCLCAVRGGATASAKRRPAQHSVP
jgi:hypothetical protein